MRVHVFLPPFRKEYPVPSDLVSRSRSAGRLCGEARCVDVNNGVGRGNRLASDGDELQACIASEHLDQMCSRTLFYTIHANSWSVFSLTVDENHSRPEVLWLPAYPYACETRTSERRVTRRTDLPISGNSRFVTDIVPPL